MELDSSIFISYSWQNKSIVNRIYFDLIRCGLKVWKDDTAKWKGEVVWSHIKTRINKSQIFLLMDSASARVSDWVKKESSEAWALAQKGSLKIVICLVESKDITHRQPQFFKQLNEILYFDFSVMTEYDNGGYYNASIHELCNFLGGTYEPWTSVPREVDLQKEIFLFPHLHAQEVETLLKDYEVFRERYKLRFPSTISRLRNIIADCKQLNIDLVSLNLALGIIYAETYELSNAEQIFRAITDRYANDPRGFLGLASILSCQGFFAQSIDAFLKCISIIEASGIKEHLEHLPEIRLDLVWALLQNGEYDNASSLLSLLPEHHRLLPKAQITLAGILMYKSNDPDAIHILEKLISDTDGLTDERPEFYLYLSEAYRMFNSESNHKREFDLLKKATEKYPDNSEINLAFAQCNAASGNLEMALDFYNKNIKINSISLKYNVEAATIAYLLSKKYAAIYNYLLEKKYLKMREDYFSPCKNLKIYTAEEYYLLGQGYYIIGDVQKAYQCYQESVNRASGVEIFPFYGELLDNV